MGLRKRFSYTLVILTIVVLSYLLPNGYLDIPQNSFGTVIKKERTYNADAGRFVIETKDKLIPKKVYYETAYDLFEVGDDVKIDYKVSLVKRPYGVLVEIND